MSLLWLPDELLREILCDLKNQPSSYFALAVACKRTLEQSNWLANYDSTVTCLPMYQCNITQCNQPSDQLQFAEAKIRLYKSIVYKDCRLFINKNFHRRLESSNMDKIIQLRLINCSFSLQWLELIRQKLTKIELLEVNMDKVKLPKNEGRSPAKSKIPTVLKFFHLTISSSPNFRALIRYLKTCWHPTVLFLKITDATSVLSSNQPTMNYIMHCSKTLQHLVVHLNAWTFDPYLFKKILNHNQLNNVKFHVHDEGFFDWHHDLCEFYIDLCNEKDLNLHKYLDRFCRAGCQLCL